MICFLLNLLLLFFVILVIFHAVTFFVAHINTRTVFSDPKFKSYGDAVYQSSGPGVFFKEVFIVFYYYITWWLGYIDRDDRTNENKSDALPPVLFVHGWTENRRFWKWMIHHLSGDPRRRLYTINLSPIDAPVSVYREQIAARIDSILSKSRHEKLTLVGHSLGGIVSRAYIKSYGGEKVERLITLGSPHHGTVLAYGALGAVPRQVEPNSEFLTSLSDGEDLSGIDLHCIISVHDNLVIPFTNGFMPQAENHQISRAGHTSSIFSTESLQIIRNAIYRGQETKSALDASKKETAEKAKAKRAAGTPAADKAAHQKKPETAGSLGQPKEKPASKSKKGVGKKTAVKQARPSGKKASATKKAAEKEKPKGKKAGKEAKPKGRPKLEKKKSDSSKKAKAEAKEKLLARISQKGS